MDLLTFINKGLMVETKDGPEEERPASSSAPIALGPRNAHFCAGCKTGHPAAIASVRYQLDKYGGIN